MYKENDEWLLKNIKDFRIQKGIKSEVIASSLGISQGDYSRLENGKKKDYFHLLPKLAEIFNIGYIELITNKEKTIEITGNHYDQSTGNTAHTINIDQENVALNKKIMELKDAIIQEKDAQIAQKDVLISRQDEAIEMWKGKYFRMKERFLSKLGDNFPKV
jgi:transcriptional regulator with XRE-family HTH domain